MVKWAFLTIMAALSLLLPAFPVDAQQGGYVDTIYFNVRTQMDIGLRDTIEGLTDLYYHGLPGAMISGLQESQRNMLDLYSVPSGSWALQFNPVPNEAPYLVKVNGKEYFNPFAMREVRFAMHDLINRQFIVDEISNGHGGPMITLATPSLPSSAFFNEIPAKLGLTYQGNEQKALQDINSALTNASNLPELKGRLAKKGSSWYFDNAPISIKFIIRVDDPERTRVGDYVSQQIQKAGIKVEKLLWDRVRAINTVSNSDPAKYDWNIYTEGWGAGQLYPFWDQIIAQMYAPFYGNMPGSNNPDWWNYKNDELDANVKKALYGDVLTEKEYWDACERAVTLGLQDAVRVYISYQDQYYPANKAKFNGRFLYDLGQGLNRLSLMTSSTKDKTLRVTEYSAQGGLFMSSWDPVGVDGFYDTYSTAIWRALEAPAVSPHPTTGRYDNDSVVVDWNSVESKAKMGADGKAIGDLAVPSGALLYDTAKKAWAPVGNGIKTISKGTETVKLWKWHDGHMMSFADYVASIGFDAEWAKKDGDADRYFDDSYSSMSLPGIDTVKGYAFDQKNNKITTYVHYNFPADKNQVMGYVAVGTGGVNYNRPIPWQLREAIGRMVAEGSASGTVYSFTSGKATDIDVLNPQCVSDIKAELNEMKNAKYIPGYLKGYTTEKEAVDGYDAIIKFIDQHKHAAISNGPFYLDTYDAVGPSLTMKRWNEYPMKPQEWMDRYTTTIPRVDRIDVPLVSQKGKDVGIAVRVSEVTYPQDTAKPSAAATVKVSVVTPQKTYEYAARGQGNGVYMVSIPSGDIANLTAGRYVITATAELPSGMEGSASSNLIIRG
jgi:peptide/nickel transport system substrate-binding protein